MLSIEIQRRAATGLLRHTARQIAQTIFGISVETVEVVQFQDHLEIALVSFIAAQESPEAGIKYISPPTVAANQAAQSKTEQSGG